MITILNLEGDLRSRVRCTSCNNGKELSFADTKGNVGEFVERRLMHTAEHHEFYHPTHSIEVTFYRKKKENLTELPIVREMRERLESLRKTKL